jgi:hypothetical protein
MKLKYFALILLVLGLAAMACSRSLTPAQPTATAIVLPSETPAPSDTPTEAPPTDTPAPSTDTPTPASLATDTPEGPTATATEPAFDVAAEYGGATILASFDDDIYWVDGAGNLPDSDFIKMELNSGKMEVTGKLANFDTWWFTWPSAADSFLQMTVDSGDCSGKQAYGFMLRGPAPGNSAVGYILTFSCDGAYRLGRLDNIDPYTFVELIPWTQSDAINEGANQTNTLGVRLEGSTITIFANGFEVEEITDTRYASGRFGLFVNAGEPGNYTYSVDELIYWNLD